MTCGKASSTSFVDFGASGLLGWVRGDLARARRCAALWARRRQQRLRLKDLDDHVLKDIGVGRAEAVRERNELFRSELEALEAPSGSEGP